MNHTALLEIYRTDKTEFAAQDYGQPRYRTQRATPAAAEHSVSEAYSRRQAARSRPYSEGRVRVHVEGKN